MAVPGMKTIPAVSRAARIAVMVLARGLRAPRSKSAIVDTAVSAALVRSNCDQFSRIRAARHCSRGIVMSSSCSIVSGHRDIGRRCEEVKPTKQSRMTRPVWIASPAAPNDGGYFFSGSRNWMPGPMVSSPAMKTVPAASRAARMAARLSGYGTCASRSKSLTVDRETLAALASALCDIFNMLRAARHCPGDIVIEASCHNNY